MSATDEPSAVATTWLSEFAAALYASKADAVVELLQSDGWFRDVLTFSWDNRTLEGREKLLAYLSANLPTVQISEVKLNPSPYFQPSRFSAGPLQGIEFGYTYETPIAHGQGFVRLLLDPDQKWRGHIVSMIIMDLKGYEEPVQRYNFEDFVGGKSWEEYTTEQRSKVESDPHVVISTSPIIFSSVLL